MEPVSPKGRSESQIYEDALVRIGAFRLRGEDPGFENSMVTQGSILVFPRTSVRILYAGWEAVVANPNVVMFYNPGQEYRREKITERGDYCEWFNFPPEVLASALMPFDKKIEDHLGQPFWFTHGLTTAATYALQRNIVEHLLNSSSLDRLFIQEASLQVLQITLEHTFRTRTPTQEHHPAQRDLALDIQHILSTRFHENLTLDGIAAEVCYSPYHISRVFRRLTGFTIHQYLNELRLRTALEALSPNRAKDGEDLTSLALRLGYSSHSHFTMAFRKAFHIPPSQIHTVHIKRHSQRKSKNLIANAMSLG